MEIKEVKGLLQKIFRFVSLLVGFAIGYQLVGWSFAAILAFTDVAVTVVAEIGVAIFGGSVFGIIFYLITPWLIGMVSTVNGWMEAALKAIPTQDIAVVLS